MYEQWTIEQLKQAIKQKEEYVKLLRERATRKAKLDGVLDEESYVLISLAQGDINAMHREMDRKLFCSTRRYVAAGK